MRFSTTVLELRVPEEGRSNLDPVKAYILGYVDATLGWECESVVDNPEGGLTVRLRVHDLAPRTFEMTNALEMMWGLELEKLEYHD